MYLADLILVCIFQARVALDQIYAVNIKKKNNEEKYRRI